MIGQSKRPLAAVATSALLLGTTLGALAGDLPYGGSYDQPTVSGAVYDWTGFYGGVHGGYGRGSGGSTDLGGFIGGFQGGYSMQQGQFVMGLEGDIGIAAIDGSRGASDTSIDALGSVRARAGFAVNQVLIYGTGGFGFGDVNVEDPVSRDDQWRLGWVLGIGAEAALGRNWTARIEAFHYDLGSATYINASGNRTISVDANVVRAGLNYRF